MALSKGEDPRPEQARGGGDGEAGRDDDVEAGKLDRDYVYRKLRLAFKATGIPMSYVEDRCGLYNGQISRAVRATGGASLTVSEINRVAICLGRPIAYLCNDRWPAGEPVPPYDGYSIDPGLDRIREQVPAIAVAANDMVEMVRAFARLCEQLGIAEVPEAPPGAAMPPIRKAESLTRADFLKAIGDITEDVLGPPSPRPGRLPGEGKGPRKKKATGE